MISATLVLVSLLGTLLTPATAAYTFPLRVSGPYILDSNPAKPQTVQFRCANWPGPSLIPHRTLRVHGVHPHSPPYSLS